jgi:hypothetical protein
MVVLDLVRGRFGTTEILPIYMAHASSDRASSRPRGSGPFARGVAPHALAVYTIDSTQNFREW